MKVLLANKFNYLKGGADKYFLDLAGMLEKKGIAVAKFSMADEKNIPDKNERYFVSNIDFNDFKIKNSVKYVFRILYSLEAAKKFEKLVLDFKPDIIHLQNIYHQISPSILSVAKKYKIPTVMHLHDYKLICPNYKLFTKGSACYRCKGGRYYNCVANKCVKNSLLKSLLGAIEMYFHHKILKIYDKVDLFIAPSQFMKDISVEFGVPAEKIKVVNNFINPDDYSISAGIGAMENYLLYLGRLSDEKGINILIDAFSKTNSDLKLKIVGDGPERNNCRLLIAKHKLENKVELTGLKHGNDLSDLIGGAKALVVPSIWPENLPYVVLESFLFGKPVIASRIGGLKDMVDDGKNGFLFEAGNIDDLADKIQKINNCDLDIFSKNAKSAIDKFMPEKHLNKILEIYRQYVK